MSEAVETEWVEVWRVHPSAIDDRLELLAARGIEAKAAYRPISMLAVFHTYLTVPILVEKHNESAVREFIARWETEASNRASSLAHELLPRLGVAALTAALGGALARVFGAGWGDVAALFLVLWCLILLVQELSLRWRKSS